jgi:hypothetical protein
VESINGGANHRATVLDQERSQLIRKRRLASGVNAIDSDAHGMLELKRHETISKLIEHLLACQCCAPVTPRAPR